MHDRVAGLEDKNGFEVYRQISQMIDAVPENSEFVMNAELLQFANVHGSRVRGFRSF